MQDFLSDPIIQRERQNFKKNTIGIMQLFNQSDFFYTHVEEMQATSVRLDNMVKQGILKLNTPLLVGVCQTTNIIYCVLREDGWVYFGINEATACLGLGGRAKDGKLELLS